MYRLKKLATKEFFRTATKIALVVPVALILFAGAKTASAFTMSSLSASAGTSTATTARENFNVLVTGAYVSGNTYYFEYGISSITTTAAATSGLENLTTGGYFSGSATGLTCGATYMYRATIRNTAAGTYTYYPSASGSTFTAASCAAAPTLSTVAATSITHDSAVLNGTITSIGGSNVSYSFNRGGVVASGTATTPGNFSTTLTGLSASTAYTFYFAGTNATGTTTGSTLSFTTAAYTWPAVSTASATSITTTSAVLNGTVTTLGSAGTVTVGFNYLGADHMLAAPMTTTGNFSMTVTGLSPNNAYAFRAISTTGSYGAGSSFTTASVGAVTSGSTYGNIHGYAWSSTVGWISLNCAEGSATGTSVCSSKPYGVSAIPSGSTASFSGKAWSSNVGWISFDSTDVVSRCGASPVLDFGTNTVSGWAWVMNGTTASGADGCIKFSHATNPIYGVKFNRYAYTASHPYNLEGFAWGSVNLGWIRFIALWQTNTPTVRLKISSAARAAVVAPITTPYEMPSSAGAATLSWAVANTGTCAATSSSTGAVSITDWPATTFNPSASGGTKLISIPANATTVDVTDIYTITCRSLDGSPDVKDSVYVRVAGIVPAVTLTGQPAGGPISTSSISITSTADHHLALTWATEGMASCVAQALSSDPMATMTDWTSSTPAVLGGTRTVVVPTNSFSTVQTYTYVIKCTPLGGFSPLTSIFEVAVDGAGASSASVNLTINTGSGAVSEATTSSLGGSSTLAWTTTGASACTASALASDSAVTPTGWSGSITPVASGSRGSVAIPGNPTASAVTIYYRLLCTASDTTQPDVLTFVTVIVASSDASVDLGISVGSISNSAGPITIGSGGASSVTLTWTPNQVSACTAATGSTASFAPTGWSGSPSSANGAHTSSSFSINANTASSDRIDFYSIRCTPLDGSPSVFARVEVIVSGLHTSPATVDLKITLPGGAPVDSTVLSPLSIVPTGSSATLTWTVSGVSSCTASGISTNPGVTITTWPGLSLSTSGGSQAITIPANTISDVVADLYTITCQSIGGYPDVSDTVEVDVQGLRRRRRRCTTAGGCDNVESLVNFYINGQNSISIDQGAAIYPRLTWTTQNITPGTCTASASGTDTDWRNTQSSSSTNTPMTYEHVVGPLTTSEDFTLSGCTPLLSTEPLPPITVHVTINNPTCEVVPTNPYIQGTSGSSGLAISGSKNFGVVWKHIATYPTTTIVKGSNPAGVTATWSNGTDGTSSTSLTATHNNVGITVAGPFTTGTTTAQSLAVTASGVANSTTITCTPATLYLVPFGVPLPPEALKPMKRPPWKEF